MVVLFCEFKKKAAFWDKVSYVVIIPLYVSYLLINAFRCKGLEELMDEGEDKAAEGKNDTKI